MLDKAEGVSRSLGFQGGNRQFGGSKKEQNMWQILAKQPRNNGAEVRKQDLLDFFPCLSDMIK